MIGVLVELVHEDGLDAERIAGLDGVRPTVTFVEVAELVDDA